MTPTNVASGIVRNCLAVLLVGMFCTIPTNARGSVPSPARLRLDRAAAPSLDLLLERLLGALQAKDKDALRALRVNRREYLKILTPGFVPPGDAPRLTSKSENEFWWSMLDGKSLYTELHLLDAYGGRQFTVKDFKFLHGKKEYAWYTAYGRILMTLEDADGNETELQMGSVAEVNGRFKFVSFTRD